MFLFFRNFTLWLVFFLFTGSSCSIAETPAQTSATQNAHELFKLSKDSRILLLPVKVEGKEYSFVLDTGTTFSCYDTSLRALLGDPVQSGVLHTPSGEKRTTLFRPPPAKLGRLDLPTKLLVVCISLEKLRGFLKEEIYGLLGMDCLKEYVVRIDFVGGEVTFLRSVGRDPGVRIPITFERDVPQVEATFPGQQVRERFQVDTGYIGRDGSLRAEVFDDLAKRGFLKLVGDAKSETALGSGSSKRGRLKEINLGKFSHKDLLFARSEVNALCLSYWTQYAVVTFDFPNKAIYLKSRR